MIRGVEKVLDIVEALSAYREADAFIRMKAVLAMDGLLTEDDGAQMRKAWKDRAKAWRLIARDIPMPTAVDLIEIRMRLA